MTEDLQYDEIADNEQNSASPGHVSNAYAPNSNPSDNTLYGRSGFQVFEDDQVYCEQNLRYQQRDKPDGTCRGDGSPYGIAEEELSPSMAEHSAAEFRTDRSEEYDEEIEDADLLAVIDAQVDTDQDYIDGTDRGNVVISPFNHEDREAFTACDSIYDSISQLPEPCIDEPDDEFPADPELFEVSPASTYSPSLQDTTGDVQDYFQYGEPLEKRVIKNVSFVETSNRLLTTKYDNRFESSTDCQDVPSAPESEASLRAETYTPEKVHCLEAQTAVLSSASQRGIATFDCPEQSSAETNWVTEGSAEAFSLPHYRRPQISSQSTSQQSPREVEGEIAPPDYPIGNLGPYQQPFLRSKFPAPVPDRSPIQGLTSSHTLLRTCFRVGEALRLHSAARAWAPQSPRTSTGDIVGNTPPAHFTIKAEIPASTTILIELYAYVTRSYRSGHRQFFTFADLFFPFRPPYLSGVWECWVTDPFCDSDGKEFLGIGGREWKRTGKMVTNGATSNTECIQSNGKTNRKDPAGRLCRVIGTLPSGDHSSPAKATEWGSGSNYVMLTVHSIWRAAWEDIEYVRGIVQA
ncbi:hypothetical protein VTN00DRAFT_4918 [Thermoascus crustaceus]|uniref:uncharacterized protein n=1 Tax=Thermoascus crustaceus TaxID=5088 RepID=UPI00374451F0